MLGHSTLRRLVNEAAALPIRAGPDGVERLANLRLVLWVAKHGAKFFATMRELALGTVSARAHLFERATKFRLVQILVADALFNFGAGFAVSAVAVGVALGAFVVVRGVPAAAATATR